MWTRAIIERAVDRERKLWNFVAYEAPSKVRSKKVYWFLEQNERVVEPSAGPWLIVCAMRAVLVGPGVAGDRERVGGLEGANQRGISGVGLICSERRRLELTWPSLS